MLISQYPFYLQAGGKDLLKRSWKDLAEHIKVEVKHLIIMLETTFILFDAYSNLIPYEKQD
jgi:hypothetical protein